MATHRQQSFIAQIDTPRLPLHFLDTLTGGPVQVTQARTGGGFFSGRLQQRDDSHLLGHQPSDTANEPLLLYFRSTDDGYALYVRSPGAHFGKCISMDTHEDMERYARGAIGAFAPDSHSPLKVKLMGSKGPMHLLDFKSDTLIIHLQDCRSGKAWHRYRRHDAPHIYMGAKGGEALPLRLRITERNAAYLSNPDEV
ncbi:hypothetical protein EXN22_05130 [Pseudomonas tructae]|uniref:Uncharacterized protein n=1 Tax=Pseudomonas tructae TaxID=2518644 RepID=A0A411ME48_9PSED|nr:hypothetical protein [Pseudomonas tructae]QBF25098.1 hypothetical protein EXN22_05130 [Pseudomonas tructae]